MPRPQQQQPVKGAGGPASALLGAQQAIMGGQGLMGGQQFHTSVFQVRACFNKYITTLH